MIMKDNKDDFTDWLRKMYAMCKEYDMYILHRLSKVFTNKKLWRGEEKC